MNTIRNHTLSTIAEQYGVEKRTVQNWLKQYKADTDSEIGELVNGTRLLSDEEVEALGKYRKPKASKDPVKSVSSVVEIVELPDLRTSEIVEFHGGQFDIQSAIANLDGALGMSIQGAEQIVQAVELITDKVASGLEAKAFKQKQELETTQDQLNRVEAARKIFRRRTTIAAQESRELAREQTEASQEMENMAQEIFNLGKPPSSSQQHSSQ